MNGVWWKVKQLAVRDRTGQVATKNCAKLKPGSRGSRKIYFQRNFYLLSAWRAAKTRIDAKRRHEAISSLFVLCANWMQRHVAQAELMDTWCQNSVIIDERKLWFEEDLTACK